MSSCFLIVRSQVGLDVLSRFFIALAQKKALLSQTQPQPQKTSSSSGHAQAGMLPLPNLIFPKNDSGADESDVSPSPDLESHQRPKFLAQDLALGSTLPLDANSLLPLALAQINKPGKFSSLVSLPSSEVDLLFFFPVSCSPALQTPPPLPSH